MGGHKTNHFTISIYLNHRVLHIFTCRLPASVTSTNPHKRGKKHSRLTVHALLRRADLLCLAAEAQQRLQARRARRRGAARGAGAAAQQAQLPVGRGAGVQLGEVPRAIEAARQR